MADQTCYWANKIQAPSSMLACKAGSGYSSCCYSGHYCFSNGLCLDPSEMTYYRGACTDQDWNSDACGRYCLEIKDNIAAVWVCRSGRSYVCEGGNVDNCYYSSSSIFSLPSASLLANNVAQSAIELTTTSSSSASGQTSTNTRTGKATSCPTPIAAYAGIGAGIGVPLIIALVLLAILFYRYRKLRKSQSSHSIGSNTVSEIPHGGFNGYQQYKPYENRPTSASPAPAYNASRFELGPNSNM